MFKDDINDPTVNKQDLCLVLGCDNDFVTPLAVALFSALRHLKKDQNVLLFLIDGGIEAHNKKRLQNLVSKTRPDVIINWIKPLPEAMVGLKGARHISSATYLRLFLPDLLPANVNRVLYLDCDLLVRSNLYDLWRVDLLGAAFAATRDFAVSQISHPYSGVKDYQKLNLKPEAIYFNAGVLLMDIAKWRSENIAEKALAYAIEHGIALGNCDQDAMNATISDNWLPLDYRWNVQYALFYLHDLPENTITSELGTLRPILLKEAKIVHFTGTPKPWNHWCGHPVTEEWIKNLLMSGWFTPKEFAIWAVAYWAKRFVFKLKVVARIEHLRERID